MLKRDSVKLVEEEAVVFLFVQALLLVFIDPRTNDKTSREISFVIYFEENLHTDSDAFVLKLSEFTMGT